MIFTGKDGAIYEIPKERYAEFEVSAKRAAEITEAMKKSSSNNNEVVGYSNYGTLNCTIGTRSVTCTYTLPPNETFY